MLKSFKKQGQIKSTVIFWVVPLTFAKTNPHGEAEIDSHLQVET